MFDASLRTRESEPRAPLPNEWNRFTAGLDET